jgi:HAD superfamily hydrolase (TIGR01490 family)
MVLPAAGTRVAAFFDIDGTLLGGRSLERNFFADLRRRGGIPARNYFLWLRNAMRLAPRGVEAIVDANKMYLRGVRIDRCREAEAGVAAFLPEAISQAAWHASLGHAIVLVSGTLAPLAHRVAIALTLRLAARGVSAPIGVCATRLEESNGRWTGGIVGEAIFGAAKARAIRRIAIEEGFDLPRCYAYGNGGGDRWMLAAVGRPAAVNPEPELESVARLHDWPVLRWNAGVRNGGALKSTSVTAAETEIRG